MPEDIDLTPRRNGSLAKKKPMTQRSHDFVESVHGIFGIWNTASGFLFNVVIFLLGFSAFLGIITTNGNRASNPSVQPTSIQVPWR